MPTPVPAPDPTASARAAPPAAMAAPQPDATAASWYGLAVLILLSLYAVLDRQVFVIQAEPIRQHLALNDFQLGLLQGLGVSLFAAVAGYPIGWLADRRDRRWVLAGCLVVWSLAVVACGLAQGFTQLLLASAMVGAGEAGVMPIFFALIPELFRNHKRQVANSLNVIAGRLGVGLVIALCGQITVLVEVLRPHLPVALQAMETWRLSFFAAALPTPLFLLLILRLPASGRAAPDVQPGPDAAAASTLPASPSLRAFLYAYRGGIGGLLLGLAVATFGLAAAGVWLPVVAMRQFGAQPVEVGNALGLATFVSGAVGLVFTVHGMRWLAPRVGPQLPVVAMGVGCALGGLSTALLLLAGSASGLFVLYGVQMTAMMIGIMAYPTALQDVAPAPMRARIFALSGMLGIVFASAAPPLVGALSDQLGSRPDGLLQVTVACSAAALLLAAAIFGWTARRHGAVVRAASRAA